jgi:hypothetical protein
VARYTRPSGGYDYWSAAFSVGEKARGGHRGQLAQPRLRRPHGNFPATRLYVVAASHPCYAVEAALRLKGLEYDRVVTSDDLRPLIEGRPASAWPTASRNYPGHMPAGTIRVPA